jgi:GT2 family glycosyltransferase
VSRWRCRAGTFVSVWPPRTALPSLEYGFLMHFDLSIIVPAFNAATTLREQLLALRDQEWIGSWEVIVVDNGSTDRTVAVFEEATGGDERFRLVDGSAKSGASFARNTGVELALAETIAFCDADDIVGAGWIAALGDALQQNDFVAGAQELSLLNPDWLRGAYGNPAPNSLQTFAEIFPYGPTANLGITKSAFVQLGGFDTSIAVYEDMDFCLRAWVRGIELVYVPHAVVHYRLRHTLAELFSQAIKYGEAAPFICKRLKEMGRPTPPRLRNAKNTIWLVRRAPQLRNAQGRARWVVVAGGLIGRLRGSWHQRYLQL